MLFDSVGLISILPIVPLTVCDPTAPLSIHRYQRPLRTGHKAILRQENTAEGEHRAWRTPRKAYKAHDADPASPSTIELGANIEDSGTTSTRPPLPDLRSCPEGLLKAERPGLTARAASILQRHYPFSLSHCCCVVVHSPVEFTPLRLAPHRSSEGTDEDQLRRLEQPRYAKLPRTPDRPTSRIHYITT
eukprot:IDg8448t1